MMAKTTLAALAGALFLAAGAAQAAEQPRCLTEFPHTMALPGTAYGQGLKIDPAPDTTVDLRGVTVRGMALGSSAKSVAIVAGFDGVCLLGGRYIADQDPQTVPWVEGHATYGAGILFRAGRGRIVVEQAVIANSLQDGITLAGGLPGDVTFELRSSWITNTSDDGIQNDGGKRITGIEDSLIEAKMGISLRPGSDSGAGPFGDGVVPIRDSLINVICVADDRPDGSDSRNPVKALKNNCGPGLAAASAFKWSSAARSVKVDVSDTVIRFGARDRNGWRSMDWPAGTYRNVTVVWDPAQAGMKYAGPALPDGVTMTTDASVWTKAKAGWLARHGCSDVNLSCTFAASEPDPEPEPDPLADLVASLRRSYPAAGLTDQDWRALIATIRQAP
jgi:hypothetical protein